MAIVMAVVCQTTFAQQDSISISKEKDTIKVGGIIILKKGNPEDKEHSRVTVNIGRPEKIKQSTKVTSYTAFIDLGISGWNDQTNYGSAAANNYVISRPGASAISSKDFKLRAGKSINVNVWLIGQRVNLIDHQLNLKYALGFEMNNYRFKNNISFSEGGFAPYNPGLDIPHAFAFTDSITFKKNKLFTNHLTLPIMLDFRTNKEYSNRGLTLAAGISFGYLLNSRTKQVSSERGKQKTRDDFDMNKWKLSYIGELGIGGIRFYGSYTPKSIFKEELNFQPYTIGLRFSNW